jgi:hypothetical protein
MRNIIWFLALFLLLIIQAGILVPLSILPINLVLVTIALAAILIDFDTGLFISLVGGTFLGFVSGAADAILLLSSVVEFLIVYFIVHEVLARDPNRLILFGSAGFGTVIYFATYLGMVSLLGILGLVHKSDLNFILSNQLPLTLMWNLVFVYPVLFYLNMVEKLIRRLSRHKNEKSFRII